MSTPTTLYINDYDTARLGLVVSRFDGAEGAPERQAVTAPLLNRAGSAVIDGRPRIQNRSLLLPGVITGATVALRQTYLRTLKERLCRGLLEIRFVDQPGYVYLARLRRITDAPSDGGQSLSPSLPLTIELECQDPYIYETGRQIVALGTTPVRLPLGTAPSPAIIRLYGAATNPVITLRHANGTVLGTLGFTVTLGSNDYLEIDGDACTVQRSVGGSVSEGLSLLTSGDFLVLDPGDGDTSLDGGPTLEVSSGTGDARWRRAWS